MLFGRLKLYLILALLLAGIVGIAYWYYNDSQNKLQLAAEKNAVLTITNQNKELAIAKLNEDIKRSQEIVAALNEQFIDLRKDYDDLKDRFTKNSVNFGTRDIGKLAENKPKLIERVINKATKNVLRCFELAAGAQRTHDEIAARKKSETNPECPALANPNYVEED